MNDFKVIVLLLVVFICIATIGPAISNVSSATAESIRIKTYDTQAASELQRQKELIEWSENRAQEERLDNQVVIIFPWMLIGCFSTIILVIISVTIVQYTRFRAYSIYAIKKQQEEFYE